MNKKEFPKEFYEKIATAGLPQVDAAWAVLKYQHEKGYGIMRKVRSINFIFDFDMVPYLPSVKSEDDAGKEFDRLLDFESRQMISHLLESRNKKM